MLKVNVSMSSSSGSRRQGTVTKKNLDLHKLAFGENGVPEGSQLCYCVRGQVLIVGHKSCLKIICTCCNSKVSPSQFEAHAGCASRRKPYMYIRTSTGVSLHQFSLNVLRGRQHSVNSNNTCYICQDGGNLLCCDRCQRVFHQDCMSPANMTEEKWLCQICNNTWQKGKCGKSNAVAAGREGEVNLIKQKRKRRLYIDHERGCALCSGHKYTKTGFESYTVIYCDQCNKQFHIGCLNKRGPEKLKKLPQGDWFCGQECKKINSYLQNLLVSGEEELPENVLGIIREKDGRKPFSCNKDVKWSLLSGRSASVHTRSLLSEALSIFQEQFDPIKSKGKDILPCIVRGEKTEGWELEGMLCAVLIVSSQVVCAASFRILGKAVAELPLIATRSDCQGQGYFQILFSCLQRLAGLLGVRSLVLPSAKATVPLWTENFGFTKMTERQIGNLKKDHETLDFEKTLILHKLVPEHRIIRG